MVRDRLIETAIEREEHAAHLRQELAEWNDILTAHDLPPSRAKTLITTDQKEGE